MSFSTEIKKFRRTFGLTQAELADKAGIAAAVLSRIENDEVKPQCPAPKLCTKIE
jgi:predicted transcriptional regulator